MRKLFILPLALLALASCDKESENEMTTLNQKKEVKMQLQGEWSNNYKAETFYNLSGEVAHRDVDSVYLDVRHNFSGDNMDISHPNGSSRESFSFAVPDSSEANYVVLSKNGSMIDHYRIVTLNDTAMVWEKTVDWAGYRDVNSNGDSITVTSRKGVYTFKFEKQ